MSVSNKPDGQDLIPGEEQEIQYRYVDGVVPAHHSQVIPTFKRVMLANEALGLTAARSITEDALSANISDLKGYDQILRLVAEIVHEMRSHLGVGADLVTVPVTDLVNRSMGLNRGKLAEARSVWALKKMAYSAVDSGEVVETNLACGDGAVMAAAGFQGRYLSDHYNESDRIRKMASIARTAYARLRARIGFVAADEALVRLGFISKNLAPAITTLHRIRVKSEEAHRGLLLEQKEKQLLVQGFDPSLVSQMMAWGLDLSAFNTVGDS